MTHIVYAADEEETQRYVNLRQVEVCMAVRDNGILVPLQMPWHHVQEPQGLPAGSVASFTLNLITERLFESYDKIDFDALRSHTQGIAENDEVDDVELDVAIQELAVIEPADAEPEVPLPGTTTINRPSLRRSVRLKSLLRLLETKFGCEVGQGKGSEITVYRLGVRKFTFGCHKRDREVHVPTVSMALRVLQIGRADFVRAAYGT